MLRFESAWVGGFSLLTHCPAAGSIGGREKLQAFALRKQTAFFLRGCGLSAADLMSRSLESLRLNADVIEPRCRPCLDAAIREGPASYIVAARLIMPLTISLLLGPSGLSADRVQVKSPDRVKLIEIKG